MLVFVLRPFQVEVAQRPAKEKSSLGSIREHIFWARVDLMPPQLK